MKYFSPKTMMNMRGRTAITVCRQNHKHSSKVESRYCDLLTILVKGKEIKGYETQQTYKFIINGRHICSHRVDFLVTTLEGKKEVHEVKQFPTEVWALKKKLFEALYPEIPYKVITKA